jgi:hypothetical protein
MIGLIQEMIDIKAKIAAMDEKEKKKEARDALKKNEEDEEDDDDSEDSDEESDDDQLDSDSDGEEFEENMEELGFVEKKRRGSDSVDEEYDESKVRDA